MCEDCLLQAQTNKANAQAVKELADAAAILSNHVAGSNTAVANIVEHIEVLAQLLCKEKVSGEAGTTPEAEQATEDTKLPPELQALKHIFDSLGIEAEVHRFPRD